MGRRLASLPPLPPPPPYLSPPSLSQPKDPWDYDSLEERLADATRIKEKGTKYFKDGKFHLAVKLYKRGSDLLTDTELRKSEQKEAAKPLRVAFYLNLAACYLKLSNPKEAITQCNDVRDSIFQSFFWCKRFDVQLLVTAGNF